MFIDISEKICIKGQSLPDISKVVSMDASEFFLEEPEDALCSERLCDGRDDAERFLSLPET